MDFLVIDDDKVFREASSLLIEDEGHFAQGAANAEVGLSLLREDKFDAVLLDLNLGRDNGLNLIPEVLKIRPNLPVVMFSAQGTVKSAASFSVTLRVPFRGPFRKSLTSRKGGATSSRGPRA